MLASYYFYSRTLLLMLFAHTLAPCYSCLVVRTLLFLLSCPIAIYQVPLGPPPPLLFHCIVARYHTLMFYHVSWYSLPTLLCMWRSLDQHQQASSNNKGFFFPRFLEFFFFPLYFVYLFCFCLSFIF
jgi:hypothetical protein